MGGTLTTTDAATRDEEPRPAPRRSKQTFAFTLLYALAAFVLVKAAATAVLLGQGTGAGAVVAFVTGLWSDGLLWCALFAVGYPLRNTPLRFVVAAGGVVLSVWGALSWGSFLVTQTWMTWQRLSGAENVKVTDVGQLEWAYAAPLAGVVLTVLALGVPAAILARRVGPRVSTPAVLGAGLAAVAVLALADQVAAPWGLYGLREQPTFELFSSMLFSQDVETEPLSAAEYARVHRPLMPYDEGPPPPPLAESPRNVILYLAEGIGTKHTNFGGRLDTTPSVFRRYEDHGLWFDNFYTHTHRSIHAIFSVVCSAYPPPTLDAMTALHPRIDCGSMMESLGNVEGMHQGLFHGGRFAFANKLALLSGRGFEVTRDAQDLTGTGDWHETWWGIDDRAVVDAALEYIDSVPRDERFFLLIIPIAPHEPYDVPEDSGIEKAVAGSTPGDRKFLRAVKHADRTFERLMTGLEDRDRYDETLTVWVPDHGNHADEPARPSRGKRVLYQHNLHVPLVLLHKPSYHGERSHRLAAQIDLSPTLTAAFGAPVDPRDRGQDLLSSAYERRRIYLLKTRGNDPFVGVVDGEYKFIYEVAAKRYEYYDLQADPDERNDISADHLARMRSYARDGVRFRSAQRQTLLQVPALVEDGGSDRDIFEAATLRCPDGPCPKGVAISARSCKGKWADAACLRVDLLPNVPVEVTLPHVVGRYDSVRVRWWMREHRNAQRTQLAIRYAGVESKADAPRARSDPYRVLGVPHDAVGDDRSVVVRLVSKVASDPVLEFVEH